MKLFYLRCASFFIALIAEAAVAAAMAMMATTVAPAVAVCNHQLCHAIQNPII